MTEPCTADPRSLPATGDAHHFPGLAWLLAGCMMIQPLSTDLYLPSLPHIAAAFGASPASAQKTLSLFMLGFASVQLLSGPLSDRWGRRPVLLAGFLVFMLASIACTLAPTLDTLVLGRFIQAVGCCTIVVVARAVINDTHPGIGGALVMARVSSIYALGPICGPLLGGYLQVAFGWRAAFVVLSLLGIALGALAFFRLPETNRSRNFHALNPRRFIENYGKIAGNPRFWAYALPGALSFGSVFVYLSGSAFLLINVFSVPTAYVGACFALSAGGYWCGTLICRSLLHRHGIDRTLRLGANASFAACLTFPALVVGGLAHWAALLFTQCLVMLAHGINFPGTQAAAVAPFPSNAGAAAALMGAVVILFSFVVGTLVGVTYDGTPYPVGIALTAIGLLTLACNRGLERFRGGDDQRHGMRRVQAR